VQHYNKTPKNMATVGASGSRRKREPAIGGEETTAPPTVEDLTIPSSVLDSAGKPISGRITVALLITVQGPSSRPHHRTTARVSSSPAALL
jgi:hypothetical protein